MIIRKYILLLLLVAVPTQTIDWVSFAAYKPFWTNVTSVITKNVTHIKNWALGITPEKAMSFAGAGLVAYFLYNKFFEKVEEKRAYAKSVGTLAKPSYSSLLVSFTPVTSLPLTNSVAVSQATVEDQSSSSGMVGASCGYHALKNGLYIAQWSKHNESQHERMNGSTYELFGSAGSPWRKKITDDRKINALKQYARSLIMIKPGSEIVDVDTSIRSQYITCLNTIASEIASYALRAPYQLSVDSCRVLLRNATNAMAVDEARKQLLKHDDTINHYFDFSKINEPKTISQADIADAMQVYNSTAPKKLDLSGDWLHEAEIKSLISENAICPEITRANVTIIENREERNNYTAASNNDDELSLVKQKLQQDYDYEHIFICGTMSQAAQSDGHWFVVVLIKRGNRREYIVADSLGTNRIRDESVKRLIQILENNNAIYPPSACWLV